MPDWKKIVREKLGTLPLTNGRRDEVIEELAQQLESAYEEALAQGSNEQEAMRRSLAQFEDWEKLRGELFQSVEGARLPVWEQNGIFSPRRLPVWIALGLSALLLALPASRHALEILPLRSYPDALSSRIFSDSALRRIEQSGNKEEYARALAFVALHSSDDLRAMHAAEKAIALDPQLTWISAHVSRATYRYPGYDTHPWIERLKAWDPQNGFPYLLEADANVHWWEPPWSKYAATPGGLRSALAAEPRWRIPMEKAFATPRIDAYDSQQFTLDRQVLQEQGFDRPDMLFAAEWSVTIPDLQEIGFYEDIHLQDIGEAAEKAGRTDDALAAYWTVVRFADRLSASPIDIVRICSNRLRRDAYKHLARLLRSKGRGDEATAVESALAALPRSDSTFEGAGYPSVEATARRSARVIVVSAVFVALLGVATVLWLIFVFALKWNTAFSHLLNRLASPLCFSPPALLLASMALFLGFYPYARSISQFHSYKELEYGYALVWMGLYGVTRFGNLNDVWLSQMFWPTVWCAAVALVGAFVLIWMRGRPRPDNPDAA
jgi:tetratricopeptide (TPR) repeat protein